METTKRTIKIRFHLGAGENFMKWRVEDTINGKVLFFNPDEYELKMYNCKLYNHKGTAEKIYDGGNKTVCAWIMANGMEAYWTGHNEVDANRRITYNPRVATNWMDSEGNNIDKVEFDSLITIGKKLYKSE
jgi:hypothetical protein